MFAQLALHSFNELWQPGLLVALLAAAGIYLWAVGPLWRRKGWGAPVSGGQVIAFLSGLALIYVAAGSPLHLIGEVYLMTAHMISVLTLTMVVPPLLIMGTPTRTLEWLLANRGVYRVVQLIVKPVVAVLVFNLLFAVWHIPGLFEAALRSTFLHLLQYATLVGTGLLAWWPLLSPTQLLPRLPDPVQMLYCFFWVAFQMFLFGAYMVVDEPLYNLYQYAPRLLNLSPLDDQLAGHAVMNLISSSILTVMFVRAFFRWARKESTLVGEEPA